MAERLDHPYDRFPGGQWLRGNLHTHTTRSDGDRPIQAVIDDYAARGYDFLMISDHDTLTGDEQYATCDAQSMLLIPGNEISDNGPHLLHVGAEQRLEPAADRQGVIDAVQASQGFVIVNHPNWQPDFDHCPINLLQQWNGYAGLEIYNGTIGRLAGSPYATNKWDMLLSRGRRVWGYANDDHHLAGVDVGLGWNMTYLTDRSVAAVIEALKHGRFYASTGVLITRIEVSGMRVTLETANADRIIAVGDHGHRIVTQDGSMMQLVVPAESTRYVRFECWGAGEQFAWTQPFEVVNS